MRLTYLIGEPGSGKTTLVDALLLTESPVEAVPRPFAHRTTCRGLAVLGPAGSPFGGTDRLSMSVQPKVIAWLDETRPAFVLGEGDRLANDRFFVAATDVGYEVIVVRLVLPPEDAAERRAARAAEHGLDGQNDSWLKGRRTKVAGLAVGWRAALIELDGLAPIHELVATLRGVAHGDRVA